MIIQIKCVVRCGKITFFVLCTLLTIYVVFQTLTKSNNTSPRAEDRPSSASASATETMADATPDYTEEFLSDPDPNLNWDFGNTSA